MEYRETSQASFHPSYTSLLTPKLQVGGDEAFCRLGAPGSCLELQVLAWLFFRVRGTWGDQDRTMMTSWWNGEMAIPWGGSECPGLIWLKAGRVYASGQS